MTEADKYKKLTPIDHVLIRPEMYVGSVETQATPMFVFDPDKGRMTWESMQVNHGLLKIIDEIILNASDNIHNSRGSTRQTYISIHVSDAGEITIENDGSGIPIVRSKEHRLYIPEMVFGHLLTSSNYHNDASSTTAGRHGYGAKLTNILSTRFSVLCRTSGREFHMSWTDHMRKATAPRVTHSADARAKNITRVRFMPDYHHFGFSTSTISLDMKRVLHKRVMDLAAMFRGIEVRLNGVAFGFRSFRDYAALYAPPGDAAAEAFVHESRHGCVAYVPQPVGGAKRVVGVVNGVVTYHGGTHCHAASDILLGALESIAKSLKKEGKIVDVARVARHFTTLVFLVQAQPKFDSQNKARLVSTVTMPRVPRNELEQFLRRMPFLDAHVNSEQDQLSSELNKEIGAGRRVTSRTLIAAITKLVDATSAPSSSHGGHVRTLIVTEGDSAKALALNSLSSEQKRFCGVFPLRGKLLNVRNRNLKRLKTCKELQDLFVALGLELGRDYRDLRELRYQRLLIMTDQDADGSHIKGLVINAFESLWPQLLHRHPGYISLFSTPIVKVRLSSGGRGGGGRGDGESASASASASADSPSSRGIAGASRGGPGGGGGAGGPVLSFYSFKDFHKWQRGNAGVRCTVKYYKGLGTSTTAEGKEYFADMEKNIMKLAVEPKDHKLLDSVFDSHEVEWRKDWMTKANAFSGEVDIDRSRKLLTIHDFVHKEMVHFALIGNARAIPHGVDGLKPSQRKILWAMLRRGGSGSGSDSSAKVSQLSGYISEVASFHHGETSLQETMIKMAHNFTGGNNVNLLVPEGQFGSRQQLGGDHAAPRYIFTKLSRFARMLFPAADDPLLDYVDEEGHTVEPNHYVPIVPLLLCNGAVGIGFGFATNIPCFHPRDVVSAVRAMIHGESARQAMRRLVPWAVGFQGTVRRGADPNSSSSSSSREFVAVGRYVAYRGNRLHLTELPWTMSIESFRLHISALASREVVQHIADYSGANHVDMDLVLREGHIHNWSECESELGLTQRIHVNGTAFSPGGVLSPLDDDLSPILQWHYDRRLDLYKRRRMRELTLLERELARLRSTHAFVEHFRQGKIDFVHATEESLQKVCKTLGMVRVEDGYDYVLRKPITFFTRTSLEKLLREVETVRGAMEALRATTPVKLWLGELDKFEKEYAAYEQSVMLLVRKELRSKAQTAAGELLHAAMQQPTVRWEQTAATGKSSSGAMAEMQVRVAEYPVPPASSRRVETATKRRGGEAAAAAAAPSSAAAPSRPSRLANARGVSARVGGGGASRHMSVRCARRGGGGGGAGAVVRRMLVEAVTHAAARWLPRLLI